MAANNNQDKFDDPQHRLAVATRGFGEHGGVNFSIECSSTFTVMKAEHLPDLFSGKRGPSTGNYLYGRSFNPTVQYLARQLAALEGAEAGYCTSSGLSAVSATLLHHVSTGDHIVTSDTVYGGTHAMLSSFFPEKFGITSTRVPIDDLAAVEAAFTPRTKVLYCESVGNPMLSVPDLRALANIAHARGAVFVVDNTFAPCFLTPISLGADVVVHSLTKYISGASDHVAGAILGSARFINALMSPLDGPLMILGPTLDPHTASAISLRVPHLPIRIREHGARALAYSQALERLGARVIYPGLTSHPHRERLASLGNANYGSGGVFVVDLGTVDRARAFIERLQNKHAWGLMAVSLGYFDTLMSLPAESTSSEMPNDHLEATGISRGLVRISAGFTGLLEERLSQLEETYTAVTRPPSAASLRTGSVSVEAPPPLNWETAADGVLAAFESAGELERAHKRVRPADAGIAPPVQRAV